MKYFRSIVSSTIGNILEWYDFGLFTLFSSLFSKLFFPTTDSNIALISTMGIFSVGFICRPLGALFFGYFGDRIGRAKTLRLSILMIMVPTLLIGCLPTYDQIGIAAPILLMLIRMWQGISIGGEYSGNVIYLAEISPRSHRATITSFASMGANIGILLAAIVGTMTTYFVSEATLSSWGWRLPYLISGVICLIIYCFRLNIVETQVFNHLKRTHDLAINPITDVFQNHFSELCRLIGLVVMGSTFYFFCFIYIPIYLKEHFNLSTHILSLWELYLIGLMIFLIPFAGYICDRIGRRKMLLLNATLIGLFVIPGFYYLQTFHLFSIIGVLSFFSILSALEQGTTPVALVENIAGHVRYTGLSLGYNLGNGLLGGTVPIICAWLATHSSYPLSPAFYISFCAFITLCVAFFFIPETKGIHLIKE